MASSQELQSGVDDAKKVRDDLKVALGQEGLTDAEYKAIQKQYRAAVKTYDALNKEFKAAKYSEEKTAGQTERTKERETRQVAILAGQAIDAAKAFQDDPDNQLLKERRDRAYLTLNAAYDRADAAGVALPRIINPIEGGGFGLVAPQPVDASAVETAVAPTVATPRVLTRAESKALATGRELPPSTVVEQKDTLPTGGGTGGGVRAGKPVKPAAVSPDAWKDILRQTFPAYTNEWLSDNATTHFGPDLIALMVEASKPNGKYQGLTTDEGRQAYALALRQTIYYTTTETNARNFDQLGTADKESLVGRKKLEIADAYGDLGFDDATLTTLATDAARKGVTGLGLKQAVYSGTFKQQTAQPALAGRALEGADADRIRQLGKSWNTKISDDQIKSILTGDAMAGSGLVLTEEGLRQQLQSKWKGAMPHLATQFDAGLTLEDIGSTYRDYAAQLLEKTPDQINMFDGPFLQAFGSQETGQLSLTDWTQKVKSDSKFGWQYTKQANQQATDVALTLARAFGKVN
jgi:hypothetical protein